MRAFVVVLFILVSLEGLCQETDTYQPDSVYRVNKVRTRVVSDLNPNPWETIQTYDTLGRLETWTLTKNQVQEQRIVYRYDENGRQTEEVYWRGTSYSQKASLSYDDHGRVTGKSLKYPDGKPKMEIMINYEPLFDRKRYLKADGHVESEIETYYEKPNISNRSKGTQGETTWNYSYRNTFSKAGRLVKHESFSGKKVVQTMLYQYDRNGLLIQKTTMSDHHPPIIENFSYTYHE